MMFKLESNLSVKNLNYKTLPLINLEDYPCDEKIS